MHKCKYAQHEFAQKIRNKANCFTKHRDYTKVSFQHQQVNMMLMGLPLHAILQFSQSWQYAHSKTVMELASILQHCDKTMTVFSNTLTGNAYVITYAHSITVFL